MSGDSGGGRVLSTSADGEALESIRGLGPDLLDVAAEQVLARLASTVAVDGETIAEEFFAHFGD